MKFTPCPNILNKLQTTPNLKKINTSSSFVSEKEIHLVLGVTSLGWHFPPKHPPTCEPLHTYECFASREIQIIIKIMKSRWQFKYMEKFLFPLLIGGKRLTVGREIKAQRVAGGRGGLLWQDSGCGVAVPRNGTHTHVVLDQRRRRRPWCRRK